MSVDSSADALRFLKILFFAQIRQATGRDDYFLKIDRALSQAEFWTLLVEAFPALSAHRKSVRLARGEEYLLSDDQLGPDDEIALIPPVSGG